MQGYDAFALECDVQVGGTEQLFNLMAGRKIQEDAGQRPHVPVTLPILVGLDGKERMSKSKGNHIGVSDSANEQYGKAMSIPDEAVLDFFVLATNVPRTELPAIHHEIGQNPMAAKKRLARTIASEFWGEAAADEAESLWTRRARGELELGSLQDELEHGPEGYIRLPYVADEEITDLLLRSGFVSSRREARRQLQQGAVKLVISSADGISKLQQMHNDNVIQLGDGWYVQSGDGYRLGKKLWIYITHNEAGSNRRVVRVRRKPVSPRATFLDVLLRNELVADPSAAETLAAEGRIRKTNVAWAGERPQLPPDNRIRDVRRQVFEAGEYMAVIWVDVMEDPLTRIELDLLKDETGDHS